LELILSRSPTTSMLSNPGAIFRFHSTRANQGVCPRRPHCPFWTTFFCWLQPFADLHLLLLLCLRGWFSALMLQCLRVSGLGLPLLHPVMSLIQAQNCKKQIHPENNTLLRCQTGIWHVQGRLWRPSPELLFPVSHSGNGSITQLGPAQRSSELLSSFSLYIHMHRKSCGLWLQNTSRIQPLLTTPAPPPVQVTALLSGRWLHPFC
jgi:hypothetical protein